MKAAKRKLATKPKGKTKMAEKHEPPKHEPPPHPAAGKTTDALKTEQEKGAKDPVDKAVPPSPIPESVEDLGIGPRDPYPDGSPPKPVAGKPMNAPPDEPVKKEK